MNGVYDEPRRYRSDDRDLEGHDNDLLLFLGSNGDWYLSIVKHGEKLGPSVRLTTSGTPRGFEGVPRALKDLYRALGGESRCKACSLEAEHGTEEDPHPVPKHLHTCEPTTTFRSQLIPTKIIG